MEQNAEGVILPDGIAVRFQLLLITVGCLIPLHKHLLAGDDLVGPSVVATPVGRWFFGG